MIEIELTKRERELIHQWIERMKEESMHWGDGEFVFTDEAIVEHKLEKPGLTRITRHHLGLILDWSESTHKGTAFTVEELGLIDKIRKRLGEDEKGK